MSNKILSVFLVAALVLLQLSGNYKTQRSSLSYNVDALARSEESCCVCCMFCPGSVCNYIDDSGESHILIDYTIEVQECG